MMLLDRRRVMEEKSLLPTGYMQAEYIRNTQDLYIDLGIKAKDTTYLNITFQFIEYRSYPSVISSHEKRLSKEITIYGSGSPLKTHVKFGTNAMWNITKATEKHNYCIMDKKIYLDGRLVSDRSAEAAFNSPSNFILFCAWDNNNGNSVDPSFYSRARVWELQIDDHKFIPCFGTSENSYGLYDTVSKRFIYKAGLTGQLK